MQWLHERSWWIRSVFGVSLLCLFVFATAWYLNRQCQDAYESYRRILALHHKRLAQSIGPESHVFLGASTMQGLDVSQVAQNAINLSIGSETLEALSQRVQHYPLLNQAQAVYLLAGYNDLCLAGASSTVRALMSVLGTIGASPKVYVVGLQLELENGPGACADINQMIRRYNHSAHQLCEQRPRCEFYDPNPELQGANGLPAPEYYEPDGVHLSVLGYRVLVEGLKSVVIAP